MLTELANSGDDFVDSFNVFLTFPFVDEVVGRDPQVARNLHMGDYTNLSMQLDLDLTKPLLPGLPCTTLSDLPGGLSLDDLLDLPNLCEGVSDALTLCVNNPSARNCAGIPKRVLHQLCESLELPLLCSLGNLLGGARRAPTPTATATAPCRAFPTSAARRSARRARPRRPARSGGLRRRAPLRSRRTPNPADRRWSS